MTYSSHVPRAAGGSTRLEVWQEGHNPRDESVTLPTGTLTGDTLELGTVTMSTFDCELWRLGVEVLQHYDGIWSDAPPSGELAFKRWGGVNVNVGAVHTFYDYIVIPTDWSGTSTDLNRTNIAFHEFGHAVRHTEDGDIHHWNWDNFRWAYARTHDGTEVSNVQYAFNEGWANYWGEVGSGVGLSPSGVPGPGYLDWNEIRIGDRLTLLSTATSPRFMLQVLDDNPGSIHSLWEFETAYCDAATPPNPYCTAAGTPSRAEPNSCPPQYHDDGATCRLDNIRAKPSYGRGVGVVPRDCGAGREYDAGLCYPDCNPGYDGAGPVCWQYCPSGYHDDGALCRRDAHIFGSDNSDCPWYDVCGLTFARGCSSCPSGYHNDGCTCRRDAHIFAKDSYGRGVGTVPDSCQGGMEYDAGLCYTPCASGYSGVGPVCWGSCPAGYDDHGATCYRAPHIIVKY